MPEPAVATAARTAPANGRVSSHAPEIAHRSLRICMVHYSHFEVDSRVQRQARALAERGAEVDCVCLSPSRRIPVGSGAISLHPVRRRRYRGTVGAYLWGYGSFLATAAAKVSALDWLYKYDLVEVHNMPDFLVLAAGAPKARGVPVVLDIHDTFPELFATKFGLDGRHPLVRLIKAEERASARMVDAVLTVTREAGERLAGRGTRMARTRVVMNSPDQQVFGPPRPPVELPRDGAVRVMYHGGIDLRFGVHCMIEAFGHLDGCARDVTLDVYGSSHETRPLTDLARDVAPGRVFVAPTPTPFAAIPGKLAAHHVGIVPTLRDDFTELLLPVKLLECVHMGMPVVVSRLPVIERYFSDDEVRYYEPGDPRALATAVAEVCREPEAARARAVRATLKLRTLAWDAQRAGYLDLVDDLVGLREADRG